MPDLELLAYKYNNTDAQGTPDPSMLWEYDHINEGCANSPTAAGKFWELVFAGHQATYDAETLQRALTDAGFTAKPCQFREGNPQIQKECMDTLPCLTLYTEGVA